MSWAAARWRTWVWGVFASILTLLAPQPAAASALPGTPIAVCVAPARAGDTVAAMLRAPASRFRCGSQKGWAAGTYWVSSVSLPPNAGENERVDVRFASPWQNRTAVSALYADGRIVTTAFDARGMSRLLRLGAVVTVPLPDRHVRVVRVLWGVDGTAALRGIIKMPMIATPAQSAQSDLVLAAIYSAFAGLCLALLLYNVALYAAMRHRFQLVYCLMVLALLAYALTLSGAIAWLIPTLDNNVRLRLNNITVALAASFALVFARTFFEERVFAGWLGRLVNWVAPMPVAAGLVFALAPAQAIPVVDRLFALSFLPLLATVAPMLWRAWRLRSNYLWLFAIAWGAPVAMGLLRIASSLLLVPWSLWIEQSTILAMGLEALLSSLAIAYRIRLLSRERDEAREQEIAARLLADIDPLTGLLNRRAFLSQAIGRSGDQCLLVIDIDHFKNVNDTIGHDGGDEVLRVIARALRSSVPDAGLVARIGGEEFAVVTDAAHPVAAAHLLDRLRAERMPFDVAVTASAGACTGPLRRETDWKAMYRRADQALFAAKAAGRDRARDGGRIAFAA